MAKYRYTVLEFDPRAGVAQRTFGTFHTTRKHALAQLAKANAADEPNRKIRRSVAAVEVTRTNESERPF